MFFPENKPANTATLLFIKFSWYRVLAKKTCFTLAFYLGDKHKENSENKESLARTLFRGTSMKRTASTRNTIFITTHFDRHRFLAKSVAAAAASIAFAAHSETYECLCLGNTVLHLELKRKTWRAQKKKKRENPLFHRRYRRQTTAAAMQPSCQQRLPQTRERVS